MPPYLAGRDQEKKDFARLLDQTEILENMVLTGLRGVGKTVLLDTLKPIALKEKWLWVGTDLSEAASVSESKLALRLMTDLSVVTSGIRLGESDLRSIGFVAKKTEQTLDFQMLFDVYEATPGLVSDKCLPPATTRLRRGHRKPPTGRPEQ